MACAQRYSQVKRACGETVECVNSSARTEHWDICTSFPRSSQVKLTEVLKQKVICNLYFINILNILLKYTRDIYIKKSLHIPIKTAGFYDVKKKSINEVIFFHLYCHISTSKKFKWKTNRNVLGGKRKKVKLTKTYWTCVHTFFITGHVTESHSLCSKAIIINLSSSTWFWFWWAVSVWFSWFH